MGLLQNQNLTKDSSQPEVTQWESTPQLSDAVNNTIIVLGVLTFALQLCLVLFCLLRCWRLDKRVRENLKQPKLLNKLTARSPDYPELNKEASYKLYSDAAAAASSPVTCAPREPYEPLTSSLFAPSIPWDLVQS